MKFFILFIFIIGIPLYGCADLRIVETTHANVKIRLTSEWEHLFLKQWDKELRISLPKSLSGDSWDMYNLSYSIDANVAMFQATGKNKYLDRALLYVENVMSTAQLSSDLKQSQFKDQYLGWSNHSSPSQGNDGKEYPLFESYLWRYVSKLLYVMSQDTQVLNNEIYLTRFEKILNFTETNIYRKWISRSKKHIYRSNAHMFSHWASISLNLYDITNKKEYFEVFSDFVKKLDQQKIVLYRKNNIDVYHWDPKWGRGLLKSQDVGHGNAVIGLIIDLYEREYFYTEDDIQGLVFLLDEVIWKDSITFSYYLDGSGDGSGWFTDGFIKLGRFSHELQKRIENHTKGRSTQFFGNGALNAQMLLR